MIFSMRLTASPARCLMAAARTCDSHARHDACAGRRRDPLGSPVISRVGDHHRLRRNGGQQVWSLRPWRHQIATRDRRAVRSCDTRRATSGMRPGFQRGQAASSGLGSSVFASVYDNGASDVVSRFGISAYAKGHRRDRLDGLAECSSASNALPPRLRRDHGTGALSGNVAIAAS